LVAGTVVVVVVEDELVAGAAAGAIASAGAVVVVVVLFETSVEAAGVVSSGALLQPMTANAIALTARMVMNFFILFFLVRQGQSQSGH
jgi:hypothetical protein